MVYRKSFSLFILSLLFNLGCGSKTYTKAKRSLSSKEDIKSVNTTYFKEKSKEFAQAIIETYDPDQHLILAWGINTTGITNAIRSELGEEAANEYIWEMPITRMASLERISDLEESYHQLTQKLFRKILPTKEQLAGRTLVLTRALWAGHTFDLFARDLIDYLIQHDYSLPIKLYIIAETESSVKTPLDSLAKHYRSPDKIYQLHLEEDAKYKRYIVTGINRDKSRDVENPHNRRAMLELRKGKYQPISAIEVVMDESWTGFELNSNYGVNKDCLSKSLDFVFSQFKTFRSISSQETSKKLSDIEYLNEKSTSLAQQMIKRYPPQDHLLLAWGINTNGINSSMRALLGDELSSQYIWEMPVTNMREISASSPGKNNVQIENLLKKILPSPDKVRGRKIIIYRVIWEGLTFQAFSEKIIEYMNKNNYIMPIEFHLIVGHPGMYRYATSRLPFTRGTPNPLYRHTYQLDERYSDLIIDGIKWSAEDESYETPKSYLSRGGLIKQSAKSIIDDPHWKGFEINPYLKNEKSDCFTNTINLAQ